MQRNFIHASKWSKWKGKDKKFKLKEYKKYNQKGNRKTIKVYLIFWMELIKF